MTNNKVIVNKNYLKLLEQGIPAEHIKMWANSDARFIHVSSSAKLPYAEIEAGLGVGANIGEQIQKGFIDGFNGADTRYNVPKAEPKTSEELVEKTIISTEIYRRARLAILQDKMLSPEGRLVMLQAQRRQVAYGLDKYPEPLNPNTWSISETVDHIMDESIDKLHYLVMLRIKLEQELAIGAHDTITVRNMTIRIARISHMLDNAIEDMGYLIRMNDTLDKEQEERINGSMDMSSMYPGVVGCNLGPMAGADMDGDTLRVFSDNELRALAAKENG